jgi:hypothetical protein
MSKATVTKLFIAGLIAVAAGAVAMVIALGAAFASDVFVLSGSDVVGVNGSPLAFALLAVAAIGGVTIIGGAIAGLVSWIGALLNTSQLQSKTWFLVLLLLGIFNLGFIAMIAYLIVGPDGTRRTVSGTAPALA